MVNSKKDAAALAAKMMGWFATQNIEGMEAVEGMVVAIACIVELHSRGDHKYGNEGVRIIGGIIKEAMRDVRKVPAVMEWVKNERRIQDGQ